MLEQKNLLLLGVVRVHEEVIWLYDRRHHVIGKGHVLLLHNAGLVLDRVLGANCIAGSMISLQGAYIISITLHEVVAVHIYVDLQWALTLIV